jgi:hypothetical protein
LTDATGISAQEAKKLLSTFRKELRKMQKSGKSEDEIKAAFESLFDKDHLQQAS